MPQNTRSGDDGERDERETAASRTEQPRDGGRTRDGSPLAGWFTETIVRAGVAIVGIVLLIFALGQAVGADLLGVFVAALTSQTGRWLAVALFAVLVIAAAFRIRFDRRTHH